MHNLSITKSIKSAVVGVTFALFASITVLTGLSVSASTAHAVLEDPASEGINGWIPTTDVELTETLWSMSYNDDAAPQGVQLQLKLHLWVSKFL